MLTVTRKIPDCDKQNMADLQTQMERMALEICEKHVMPNIKQALKEGVDELRSVQLNEAFVDAMKKVFVEDFHLIDLKLKAFDESQIIVNKRLMDIIERMNGMHEWEQIEAYVRDMHDNFSNALDPDVMAEQAERKLEITYGSFIDQTRYKLGELEANNEMNEQRYTRKFTVLWNHFIDHDKRLKAMEKKIGEMQGSNSKALFEAMEGRMNSGFTDHHVRITANSAAIEKLNLIQMQTDALYKEVEMQSKRITRLVRAHLGFPPLNEGSCSSDC